MQIDVLTLFPGYFIGPLAQSMMRKATEQKLASINIHDLREHGIGPRRQVDDIPYGGGAGMVLRPEPLFSAFGVLGANAGAVAKTTTGSSADTTPSGLATTRSIYLTPQGKPFNQAKAQELAEIDHLVLLAGHYEGIDYRAREQLIDEEISIGDYVLTGGELPALVLIDAVVRLVPGVLGDERSGQEETFSKALDGGLEYPHYTRPETFTAPDGQQLKVPDVLLSGHHAETKAWRKEQSKLLTQTHRPDLMQ